MQNDKFDAIPIPEELNQAVRAGIKEGLRQRRKLCRRRTAFRYSAAAAGILAALCAGMLLASNPVLAAKLPLIGRIFPLFRKRSVIKAASAMTQKFISRTVPQKRLPAARNTPPLQSLIIWLGSRRKISSCRPPAG